MRRVMIKTHRLGVCALEARGSRQRRGVAQCATAGGIDSLGEVEVR